MKKEKILNRWAITGGIILATLDFIFIGSFALMCSFGVENISSLKWACGEVEMIGLLHQPTVQIILLLLLYPIHESTTIMYLAVTISGIIQYFIIGYLIGYFFFFTKNQLKRLF